jgi:phospholipid/cholesterol/gamma-HCH transport system permease protein
VSTTPPRLNIERAADGVLRAGLSGDWVAEAGLPGTEAIEKQITEGQVKALTFEASGMGRWDSGLVSFLFKCNDLCERTKVEFRADTLPAGVMKLIRLAQAVPEKKDAARTITKVSFVNRVGGFGIALGAGSANMLGFLGESVLAFVQMARGKAQFRWPDLWLVVEECGPQALPIVALINFLIGLILAFVGATQLARFGAAIYTADLVAVATVREMGCIMTGIILCGRTGAAFAAQLGTMKVNQEIEAFQTFAISPIEFLVLPRMMALILMMPLLCLFADAIAIGGGLLVSSMILDVAPSVYLRRTVEAITLAGFFLGIFKGAFFGVLIALTGCLRGMQCGTNAAAVGQATTSAVVTGITAIIASDGIFAVLCNALHI